MHTTFLHKTNAISILHSSVRSIHLSIFLSVYISFSFFLSLYLSFFLSIFLSFTRTWVSRKLKRRCWNTGVPLRTGWTSELGSWPPMPSWAPPERPPSSLPKTPPYPSPSPLNVGAPPEGYKIRFCRFSKIFATANARCSPILDRKEQKDQFKD